MGRVTGGAIKVPKDSGSTGKLGRRKEQGGPSAGGALGKKIDKVRELGTRRKDGQEIRRYEME